MRQAVCHAVRLFPLSPAALRHAISTPESGASTRLASFHVTSARQMVPLQRIYLALALLLVPPCLMH
jgi:hypothetical protein